METYFDDSIVIRNNMPCHNKQTNNVNQDHAIMKQVRFANSNASISAVSNSGVEEVKETSENGLNTEVHVQLGPQLKLLPLNDQIRELQTIIRDM